MNSENIIREKLNRFADKLIDLSKRNKLIKSNFQSKSKTHFRVIDEVPDLLYRKLLKNDMEFISLPPLDIDPEDEKTPKFKKSYLSQKILIRSIYKRFKKLNKNKKTISIKLMRKF